MNRCSWSAANMAGLVVLGGRVTGRLAQHLIEHGAVVFPAVTQAPVDAFRTRLYQADELYAGLTERGYDDTLDARAYHWSVHTRRSHDVFAAMVAAIHDTGMADALQEVADGAPLAVSWVGTRYDAMSRVTGRQRAWDCGSGRSEWWW